MPTTIRSFPRRTNASPIAAARIAAGFTQAALSRSLNVGIATLQRWENGITSPNGEKLKALANALGVTVEDLIK